MKLYNIKKPSRLLFGIIGATLVAHHSYAATISWTSASFTDVAQLNTTGTLVNAATSGATTTLNGITFNALGIAGGGSAATIPSFTVQNGTMFIDSGIYDSSAHTVAGMTATVGDAFLDALIYGAGANSDLMTITGLTSGNTYTLQLLTVDDRSGPQTISVFPVGGGTASAGPSTGM